MSFVSCVCWIKRGVATSKPYKVKLSSEELKEMIKSATTEKNILHPEENLIEEEKPGCEESDEYNFNAYDLEEENVGALLAIENVAALDRKMDELEEESESEDEVIKDTDNLIVVGSLENECDSLNVYVYNEEDNDLYVHHDIMVQSSPLCIEWINHTNQAESANFIAVGTMSPVIEIWDVDMINAVQPVCMLGYKATKKKYAHRNSGHKDAVLDLSWNIHLPHILASSSADKTILLWDLDSKKASTTLTNFCGKIETVEWHTKEGQTLLAGSSDSSVKIFDCRYKDTFKEWKVIGEALIAKWNIWNPYCCLVGTSYGQVTCIDCRSQSPLWTTEDSSDEITGLSMSAEFPGLLITCHLNGTMRFHDIRANPVVIADKAGTVGNIHAFAFNPDSLYIGCIGGSKKSKNFDLINLKNIKEVVNYWKNDLEEVMEI